MNQVTTTNKFEQQKKIRSNIDRPQEKVGITDQEVEWVEEPGPGYPHIRFPRKFVYYLLMSNSTISLAPPPPPDQASSRGGVWSLQFR